MLLHSCRAAALVFAAALAALAQAQSVGVQGTFGDKALLIVDGRGGRRFKNRFRH